MACQAASSTAWMDDGARWLLRNMEHHTFQTPVRVEDCEFCNYRAESECDMVAHLFSHASPSTEAKPDRAECTHCGKTMQPHQTKCGCQFDCVQCLRAKFAPRAQCAPRMLLDSFACPQCSVHLSLDELDDLLGRSYIIGLLTAAIRDIAGLFRGDSWNCPSCKLAQPIQFEQTKARKGGVRRALLGLQQSCSQCQHSVCIACSKTIPATEGLVHPEPKTACLQACLVVVERALALISRSIGVSPDATASSTSSSSSTEDRPKDVSNSTLHPSGIGYGTYGSGYDDYGNGSSANLWNPSMTLDEQRKVDHGLTKKLRTLCQAVSVLTADYTNVHPAFDYLFAASTLFAPIIRSYLKNDSFEDMVLRSGVYMPLLKLLRLLFHSKVLRANFAASVTSGVMSLAEQVTLLQNKAQLVSKHCAEEHRELFDALLAIRVNDSNVATAAASSSDADAPVVAASSAPQQLSGEQYFQQMSRLQFADAPIMSNHTYAGQEAAPSRTRLRRLARELDGVISDSFISRDKTSIIVRVDSSRIDHYRVMITGPRNTPYSFGCFLFDINLPADFPQSPPQVTGLTHDNGTVRFNPNLYANGYVCLTLLGTWHGDPEEMWNPDASSLLQVLISIQSFILGSEEPYFNEPGYASSGSSAASDQEREMHRRNTIRVAINNQLRDADTYPEFAEAIRTHIHACKDEIIQAFASVPDQVEIFKKLIAGETPAQ